MNKTKLWVRQMENIRERGMGRTSQSTPDIRRGRGKNCEGEWQLHRTQVFSTYKKKTVKVTLLSSPAVATSLLKLGGTAEHCNHTNAAIGPRTVSTAVSQSHHFVRVDSQLKKPTMNDRGKQAVQITPREGEEERRAGK